MIGSPPLADGARPTFLQLYIYDSNELADRLHLDVAKGLRPAVLEQLQSMLHNCNPFVQFFKKIDMAEFGPNVNLVLQADVGKPFLNLQFHVTHRFYAHLAAVESIITMLPCSAITRPS